MKSPGLERVLEVGDGLLSGQDVVELSVFVPGRQAAALEARAHRMGLTTAQVVRRLIQEFTEKMELMPPASLRR